ncbi:excinuclease ABC subunit UvrC [Ruficoccus amylovorans]|uniref:Excinuclease ABC subunit UvrC n=1 Tax=Ruficoccus amylovorans TaxID=1804625 RepID=A0A842HIX3_9BACT|nr:excinuclease ABC subunit UvrC [Ruficoccus amylovorans]MBC2595536.1 excinuclease ABC subunit UvrC [Ruficoccus amylovorans]
MPTPQTKKKLNEAVRRLPHTPGVYLMKDRVGTVLYVGKAKDLKKRVSTYFQPSRKRQIAQPKVTAMIDLVHEVETIDVRTETEALLLEGRLIKEYKPKYNTDFTDNKQFLLVRVDIGAELPRFRLARNRKDDGARYFGPFVHAALLRKTLAQMRIKYGILLGDAHPVRLPDGRWLRYDDARSEIYHATEPVTPEQYRVFVDEACAFLEGKSREWLARLREKMAAAAEAREYEKAAELRDQVKAMEATLEPARRFTRTTLPLPNAPQEAMVSLQKSLALPTLPRHMECFDISHISGSFVVASMAYFAEGRPDRAQNRRYQIKSFVGNDDFRAMEEVVGRRYLRLKNEGRPMPDLVVIDGGQGQVHAAMKAFLFHGLEMPPLIGLAKKEETVIFSDGRDPLNLPHHDTGLRLLQRLRDEAHRLANGYNAQLRSRRIRETVLDEFEGLGPVRRKALLEHFGSLERLRKAGVDDLQQVEGIGPKLAVALHAFLRREPSPAPTQKGNLSAPLRLR